MTQFAIVKITVPAVHHWPNAPTVHPGFYLKNVHRHMFHFKVQIEQFNLDRDIEYMATQKELLEFLGSRFEKLELDYTTFDFGSSSCEQLAVEVGKFITRKFGAGRQWSVTVLEDGENGARVSSK